LLQRYFLEPYRFVPPYRGKFWCRLAGHIMPNHLRRGMGVPRWRFQGVDHLRDSLAKGAGILLSVNHCRRADPVLLGTLGLEVRQYLYYVVSYHLFKQGRLMGWWLNRIGGYSILREGADREAIRATVQILAAAERPVVMFPEGTWFRQNDRVGPLQEGLSLIVRQAAKQSDRPIVVHPVGMKYWLLKDPRPELGRRLEAMERSLGWKPQRGLDLPDRIAKVGEALLSIKEVEFFGKAQSGALDERIPRLAAAHVAALEKRYLNKEFDGWTLERARRLRVVLVRRLVEVKGDAEASRATRDALDDLLFAENLVAHSHEYLRERPSLERMTETVERIEETLTDAVERPLAPLGADVAVGPALDVRALAAARGGRGPDPLLKRLAGDMQGLLDGLLAHGPPAEWDCPAPVERPVSVQCSAFSVQQADESPPSE
jgi:1-acyl-sn-glycerol-3-phosphate acyltransferase